MATTEPERLTLPELFNLMLAADAETMEVSTEDAQASIWNAATQRWDVTPTGITAVELERGIVSMESWNSFATTDFRGRSIDTLRHHGNHQLNIQYTEIVSGEAIAVLNLMKPQVGSLREAAAQRVERQKTQGLLPEPVTA